MIRKDLCKCKTFVDAFAESVQSFTKGSGITPSSQKKRKNMSVTEAKKAASETFAQVFHDAMRNYEEALKSGIKLQEESVNLWKDLLTKLGSPEELQAKLEAMRAEAFPKARERMEEWVETFNRTSKQTIDLFGKTLSVYQATSVTD